ncbi:MAG: hypothetical protein M3024_13830 [Candidatus Dormibacteraeota bacterium]|nr:hypothetical protein [Candidatus Dormibacteraeota bacterium]
MVLSLAAVLVLSGSAAAAPAPAASTATSTARADRSECGLGGPSGSVKHVIDIAFDNVHLSRDNPNVPSDLEQMPNLLSFVTSGGTLLSHEHTPLIAHTADDLLTSATGVYGDRLGQPVSNSFGFYDTNAFASFRSSFAYWTAGLGGKHDNTPFLVTAQGKNAPAPWVPFTRAGCSVGEVAAANTVLENTSSDISSVFGPGSPEALAAQAAFNIPCGFGTNPPCTPAQQKAKNQPQADFVGIAVHCAKTDAPCAAAKGARPDVLPAEPGGYRGFSALFGAKYTNPFISPNAAIKDLAGNPIQDATGNPGFPGFDSMSASASLAYVAAMQEHGVPVTYAYISDAHDNHTAGRAFGPGEAGYVAALKAYDTAFGELFGRLQRDGINRSNTAFVFTSDEGDHFVGGNPTPAGCNGVTTPCTYAKIGELDANLSGLLGAVPPYSTGTAVPSMNVHSDSAPVVYLDGNPGQADAVTRTAEQASGHIQAVNPINGETDHVTNYLAGVTEMRNLHMITGDPARNATFTLFARPDYYLCATGFQCSETGTQVVQNPGFAWNHGDVSPDINNTWLGLVGPGVRRLGVDGDVWSDHSDDRPTLLALAGLKDDYAHQGRILAEALESSVLRGDARRYIALAEVYDQLQAPVGQFGLATLRASTVGLESSSTGDATNAGIEAQLRALGGRRDALAAQMSSLLDRQVATVGQSGQADDGASVVALQESGFELLRAAWLLAGE